MDERMLDGEIKKSLLKATDDWLPLKKEIWNNIQDKVEYIDRTRAAVKKKKSRRKHVFSSIALTAAALIIVLVTSTNAGKAAVARIKDLLLPEKNIVQDIEGQKEDTRVNLKEGSGYVIYIDENNYQMIKQDGKDKIIPKNNLDSSFPEVYLAIQHVKDKTLLDMVPLIEEELKASFEYVDNYGTVEKPVKSISLYARSELEPRAPIVTYYLVDDNQGGSYVIEQRLFLEAAEGHGARFYHMLKEFKVINPQE
ncbi:MAG: hypothetical protein GX094_02755 [Clostridiales bacterium]|jgi:hypothetical protein|nr:hypothetical protein [Clostridiales bacterium]